MTHRHRITTLTLLGLTGLVLVVGCQWSGRAGGLAARRTNGAPGPTASSTALSNQQVADMHLRGRRPLIERLRSDVAKVGLISTGKMKRAALGGKAQRRRPADSPGSAGDQHRTTHKPCFHLNPLQNAEISNA